MSGPPVFRTLFRRQSASLSAMAILAIGIGISAAMYTLVDAVLLRPLPFPGQQAIEVIWKKDPLAGAHVEELAYPELLDLQQNIAAFQYVALLPTSLYGYGKVIQMAGAAPVQVESAPVSHDFFRVLGVAPALGRNFEASDEQEDAPPVVILSDGVWRRQFGANRRIVGRMVRLNGQGYTIIGVMAPGAEFPRGAELWVPLGVDRRVVERRGATFLMALARRKPGVPGDSIAAQVNALFTRQAADHPEIYSRTQQAVVTPLTEYWTGSARLHLWIMLGASLLLLAAAVITAGNLILSRTLSRRREMATRSALGASRTRILLQFAAEGLAAGIVAAAAGLPIAYFAVRFLVSRAPADIPRLSDAVLHFPIFCVAAAAAMVAAVGCSILPGWFVMRAGIDAALREGGARTSLARSGRRTQSLFLVAQAAVTVVLLTLAALLVLSYHGMMTADLGFGHRDAITMNVALRGPGLFAGQANAVDARHAFYTRLLERLRAAPGVTSAAAVLLRPLEGDIGWDRPYQFEFEAGKHEDRELPKANFEAVTPGYFETVGTPLLEGRDFSEHDTNDAEAVAIVSRTLAQRIRQAGHAPLGYRMRFGVGAPWLKIVGVTADARYRSITRAGGDLYVPYLQTTVPTNYVAIRGTAAPAQLAALVRRTLAELDPNQAVAGVASLGESIDRNAARHRFNMMLLLWFGVAAVILAAAGVYSVIAEGAALRSREIAIKSALGAGRSRLVRELVARVLLLVLAGEATGMGCATGLAALLGELLYGVSAKDPAVTGAVLAFLFAVSFAAAFLPAWRASGRERIDSL